MIFWKRWKLKKLIKKAKKELEKREQGKQPDLKNEIDIHLTLARYYEKHRFDKHLPNAEEHALEYYRHAANLGSVEAQYAFGHARLEKAKFWEDFAKGPYGSLIHQVYYKACYDEAFNYLREAEKSGYPLALRALGLAYIHGWGVDIDKQKGFQLIVDSIEQEQSWDKAPELFKSLGLNNPEFFSTMMAMKGRRSH